MIIKPCFFQSVKSTDKQTAWSPLSLAFLSLDATTSSIQNKSFWARETGSQMAFFGGKSQKYTVYAFSDILFKNIWISKIP